MTQLEDWLIVGFGIIIGLLLLIATQGEAAGLTASFYSTEACAFNKHPRCPTASGKSLYDLEAQQVPFAASWDYPLGTWITVCHALHPGRCVRVVVEDRGPAKRLVKQGRVIDLSKQAFLALDPSLKAGIVPIRIVQEAPVAQ